MSATSSHMWYVRAAGRVWGPYPEARVAAFVAEVRVRADTPVSPWNEGPFAPAGAHPEYKAALESAAAPVPPVPASPTPRPRPAPVIAARSASAPPAAAPVFSGPPRPLLVWAQAEVARRPALLAALVSLGPSRSIQPGLWLVQARANAAAVRNHLSRGLGPADRLLVVHATLEHAAWFNLDGDHELRRLWSGGGPAVNRLAGDLG